MFLTYHESVGNNDIISLFAANLTLKRIAMKYINLWLFFVLLTVSSCSDTEKDKLYERPDW